MPLVIHVKEAELFNQANGTFYYTKPCTLILEHSLVSISKWESKWHKMYLETPKKTTEELIDYIRCMTINKDVPDYVYYALSQENITDIIKYMEDSMTASTVNFYGKAGPHEPVSSELIYYWMITFGIPVEFEKWHINRLMMLIKICSKKNSKPSKADKAAADRQRAEINRMRCAKLGTRG